MHLYHFIIFIALISATVEAKHWTDPVYLEPRFSGTSFSTNKNETTIYFTSRSKVYYSERIGPNEWTESILLDASWNNQILLRNSWVDPDEQTLIISKYTNNWQIYMSRKDSIGVWGSLTGLPSTINSSSSELWASFSPNGEWLYFERDISGWEGSLLRSQYINDSTFSEPEILVQGMYGINYGGDEMSCTLSPNEDELIFGGYRYWYREGKGNIDLFSSTIDCSGNWAPITRLSISVDSQFDDLSLGSGVELFPHLSYDNRTLYFNREHYEESDSGLVPTGGFTSSKRIWSKATMVCQENLPESGEFRFDVQNPDSLSFKILDESGSEIIRHVDTVDVAGLWRVQWYGINDTGGVVNDGNYTLKIESDSTLITFPFTIVAGVIALPDAIVENKIVPTAFQLKAFPNPFNSRVGVRYALPFSSDIVLTIYDIAGHTVITQKDTQQVAGTYTVHWNGVDGSGSQVNAGVYFARILAENLSQTIKIVYLK